MKKLLFIIIALAFQGCVSATQWMSYFVYFETEILQSNWVRMNLIEESDYKYLAPQIFEDLLGSEKVDFAKRLMGRLKEKKPKLYDWDYDLILEQELVMIKTDKQVDKYKTVKNEIIATMLLNGFEVVNLRTKDKKGEYTLQDLTLPYFDLVVPSKKTIKMDKGGIQFTDWKLVKKISLMKWVIILVLFNALLISLFFWKVKTWGATTAINQRF